tara:strand:- start:5985 stop:6536 length:552 start_codon:yes stop_codon:yes gene_type:complete
MQRIEENLAASELINAFTLYTFVQELTTPFMQTDAYRQGLINEKGDLTKKYSSLTAEEKQIVTPFKKLVFKIKQLFEMIPNPAINYKLRGFTTALGLLAEEAEKMGADREYVIENLKSIMFSLKEENGAGGIATNSMGAAAFGAGPDVGISSRNDAIQGFDIPLGMDRKTFLSRRKKKRKKRK